MDLGTVMNVWEMEQFDGFSIVFKVQKFLSELFSGFSTHLLPPHEWGFIGLGVQALMV